MDAPETEVQILERLLNEPVTVTSAEGDQVMTTWDAIVRVLLEEAKRRQPYARKISFRIADRWKWMQIPAPARRSGVLTLPNDFDEDQ